MLVRQALAPVKHLHNMMLLLRSRVVESLQLVLQKNISAGEKWCSWFPAFILKGKVSFLFLALNTAIYSPR